VPAVTGVTAEVAAVAAGCLVVWGLVSGRLARWNVTGPIAFVVLGLVVSHGPLDAVHLQPHSPNLLALAEVTLALVLFTDASRVNVHALRTDVGLPVRLLGVGLPLTIALGALAAFALFGGIGFWAAAAIGAIVAPTDASLGAAIVSDERIPERIRRLLNVESGLNDGIATPFVNCFLALAATAELAQHRVTLLSALRELAVGVGLGVGMGAVGGLLLAATVRRGWCAPAAKPLVVFGLALATYSTALVVEGNGFVAAFVAGMAFGAVMPADDGGAEGFSEEAGSLLALLVWFIFGAAIVVPGLKAVTWSDAAFAVLALTVVRMAPVALSLVGTGLDRTTVALVGWFGPRGLASVVFGLIAYDELAPADAKRVLAAVTLTVVLSVVAHGVTAGPFVQRYAASLGRLGAGQPEHAPTSPFRVRPHLAPRRADPAA
jgi:NhaP-type Na+/H+ or K+/H+ antiporter